LKSGDQLAGAVAGNFPTADLRQFAPTNDPAVYAYRVTTTHGNIYRIPIL
jgi:hypothetical protein